MSDNLLAELVRRQTNVSMLNVFNRTIDRVAEELAQELLRDASFREQMRDLVREAFTAALKDLQGPPPL